MLSNIALLAGFAFFFSLVSGRISSTVLTGADDFRDRGSAHRAVGSASARSQYGHVWTVRSFADWTLAIILFTDAAEADRKRACQQDTVARTHAADRPAAQHAVWHVGRTGYLPPIMIFIRSFSLLSVLPQQMPRSARKPCMTRTCPPICALASMWRSGLNDGLTVPALLVFIGLALAESTEGLGGPWGWGRWLSSCFARLVLGSRWD